VPARAGGAHLLRQPAGPRTVRRTVRPAGRRRGPQRGEAAGREDGPRIDGGTGLVVRGRLLPHRRLAPWGGRADEHDAAAGAGIGPDPRTVCLRPGAVTAVPVSGRAAV